jgi:hypothetical protein
VLGKDAKVGASAFKDWDSYLVSDLSEASDLLQVWTSRAIKAHQENLVRILFASPQESGRPAASEVPPDERVAEDAHVVSAADFERALGVVCKPLEGTNQVYFRTDGVQRFVVVEEPRIEVVERRSAADPDAKPTVKLTMTYRAWPGTNQDDTLTI